MTIDPKDLRRLIIRVVAVTVALRALHLFSVDFGATEVASAWALPAAGHHVPALHRLLALWRGVTGGFPALVRAPSLIADVALPLIAVAHARSRGWGTLAGLMAGLILAVAPFGLDEGWRADGTPWLALCGFAALWQLRVGLRDGAAVAVARSAALFAAGACLSPMSLIVAPAGLYAAARVTTTARVKTFALVGWSVAAVAGVAGSVALAGSWLPGLDQATAWLATADTNGGLDALSGRMDTAWQALAAVSPGGASGGLASLAEAPPAPLWRGLLGALLWPLACLGFWRGRAQADHGVPPRRLTIDDAVPLLLPIAGALTWAGWAAAHHDAAGILAAVAVARPFAAIFLGLGVTAAALMPFGTETLAPGRRAVPILVAVALLQFGLGAHHTFVGVQDPSRMASTKVARFVAGNVSRGGAVLALGLGGLQVAWRLGPWPDLPRVHRASAFTTAGDSPAAAALALLAPLATARRVVVVGDRWAIESDVASSSSGVAAARVRRPLGAALHARLHALGFAIIEDGHRILDRLSVRVYARSTPGKSASPSIIKPQLFPEKSP